MARSLVFPDFIGSPGGFWVGGRADSRGVCRGTVAKTNAGWLPMVEDVLEQAKRGQKREKKISKKTLLAALALLGSPRFFCKLLEALEREGLVGEQRNALVVFIVVVSRLLAKPLNLFVKGQSSSGKN